MNFDPIWCYPKPIQKPYPPVFLGGHKAASLKRVVDYCDGWMPVLHLIPDFCAIADLRRRAEEAGRDPTTIKTIVMGAPRDRKSIDRLEAAGVDCAVFHLRPAGGRRAAAARPHRPANRAVNRSRKRYLTAKALSLL